MTPRERVENAIARHGPDVVPVVPFVGFYAARIAGVSISRYVTDGRTIAEAQYLLWRELGQDMVVTAGDTYYLAQGFGLEVDQPNNSLPTAKAAVLGSLADAGKLKVPSPRNGGRMPVYLKAARLLCQRFGDRLSVRGTGTGPLSLAAYLLGIENLLTKLAELNGGGATPADESDFHTLMEIVSDATIAFLKAQVELGVHIIYLGDSLASCDMISPVMYRRFVLPYHKKIFHELQDGCRRRGAHTLLHVCGNNTAILDDLSTTGAEIYEVDSKIDLEVALRMIGSRICLIGNLDPVGLLLNGSAEDVRRESRKRISAAPTEGGFMLGTGCFVAWDTPLANLKEMVQASRGLSAG